MFKKIIKIGFVIGIVGILFTILLDFYIVKSTKKQLFYKTSNVKVSYTGLVLGARVYKSGNLSLILKDRVEVALELYKNKKIKRFLLSGDHGTKAYDEVNAMKNYLLKHGVPEKDIFLDHAGFDTYNSIVRAKKVFLVNNVIIITQKFHLKRSLFIANNIGLKAQGFICDKHNYGIAKAMFVREKLANVKAFFEVFLHRKPKYLGKIIPITKDSKLSFD